MTPDNEKFDPFAATVRAVVLAWLFALVLLIGHGLLVIALRAHRPSAPSDAGAAPSPAPVAAGGLQGGRGRGSSRLSHQRGAAVLLVMLMLLMGIGVIAAGVLSGTQTTLSLSAGSREEAVAFDAAESGAERGRKWLSDNFAAQPSWTPLLTDLARRCAADAYGQPWPPPSAPVVAAGTSRISFCVLDNPDDPSPDTADDGDGIVLVIGAGSVANSDARQRISLIGIKPMPVAAGGNNGNGNNGNGNNGNGNPAPIAAIPITWIWRSLP